MRDCSINTAPHLAFEAGKKLRAAARYRPSWTRTIPRGFFVGSFFADEDRPSDASDMAVLGRDLSFFGFLRNTASPMPRAARMTTDVSADRALVLGTCLDRPPRRQRDPNWESEEVDHLMRSEPIAIKS
ncbi:MAG: hypothetical protein WKG01_11275 [Kofleriaceae bacterium]